MKVFVLATCATTLLAQHVSAQSIEMSPSTFGIQSGGFGGLGATMSAATLCSSSPGAQRTCAELRLDNPVHAIGFHSLKRLEAIQLSTHQTSGGVQNLSSSIVDLNTKVDALTEAIETVHNNQLIAIRDQLVSQMESIPLSMIDDEAVIAEIRALVVQEVEEAFQRRE